MTGRKRIAWTTVAALFTAVNFIGAVMAGVAGEGPHAALHVVLGIVGLYLTWRLSPWRMVDRIFPPGVPASAELLPEQMDRLAQIEQSVDAVAIEVERIGEGQRFMTRVLTGDQEARALEPGSDRPPAEPPSTPPDPRRR
jgi:hypothetical protein